MKLGKTLEAIQTDANLGNLSGFRAAHQLDNLLHQLHGSLLGRMLLAFPVNARMVPDEHDRLTHHGQTVRVEPRPTRQNAVQTDSKV